MCCIEYIKDLFETFKQQLADILCTSFLIWAIFPVLILALGGIGLLFSIITLETFTRLWAETIIPWWVSIIINFWKFIFEYLFFIILATVLVHQEWLEPIKLKDLIKKLKDL